MAYCIFCSRYIGNDGSCLGDEDVCDNYSKSVEYMTEEEFEERSNRIGNIYMED